MPYLLLLLLLAALPDSQRDRDARSALALASVQVEAKAPAKAPPRPTTQTVIVPMGSHAHRRMDGSVIIHSDANVGNHAAHTGIAFPYPKLAVAGQRVTIPK